MDIFRNEDWIDVKEELPSNDYGNIPVLIWYNFDIYDIGYFRNQKWININGDIIDNVTYWMVFPRGPHYELIPPKIGGRG